MVVTATATQQIKKQLRKADACDFLEIEVFVSDLVQQRTVDVAVERRVDAINHCIKCCGEKLQPRAKSAAGVQRFKCRDCSVTFSATNGTPSYRLRRRSLWSRFLRLMGQHIALWPRDQHGFNLSLSTLHRWRHRFLAPLAKEPLAGLVEADEKFFRTSYKGDRGWKRGAGP